MKTSWRRSSASSWLETMRRRCQ